MILRPHVDMKGVMPLFPPEPHCNLETRYWPLPSLGKATVADVTSRAWSRNINLDSVTMLARRSTVLQSSLHVHMGCAK